MVGKVAYQHITPSLHRNQLISAHLIVIVVSGVCLK